NVGLDFTQDHAWFAAYAPADAPKIVVVAFVEHGGVGADAAAPIVMKVIDSYLGSHSDSPQPRRPGGVPPPLPGQRQHADAGGGPDRAVALTGARLPGDRPLG